MNDVDVLTIVKLAASKPTSSAQRTKFTHTELTDISEKNCKFIRDTTAKSVIIGVHVEYKGKTEKWVYEYKIEGK